MDIEQKLKEEVTQFTDGVLKFIPDNIWEIVIKNSLSIFLAILIFFVGKWLVSKIVKVFTKVLKKAGFDDTLVKFLDNIVYYTLLTVVVLTALNKLGIQTTSFIAILGAASLAVGLALRDSLNNFASGVMIIIFRPFKVGDSVSVSGISGTVTEVTIFNTVFLTADNQKIIVPNGSITKGAITNVNANSTRRVDITLSLCYENSLKEIKDVLNTILSQNEKILKDKSYSINVTDLAESSIKITVCAWVNSSDFGSVKAQLFEDIKNRFDEVGIKIAYSKREAN